MKLRFLPALFLAALSPWLVRPTEAATVSHWRFESLLVDTVGGRNLTAQGASNAPTSYTLPGTGAGSAFSDPIPLTGQANNSGAAFNGSGYFSTADHSSLTVTTQMTIEVFFNATAIQTGAATMFASQWNTASDQRGWFFGAINGGGSEGYQLRFGVSANGATSVNQNSGFDLGTLTLGKDYYAAVSYNSGIATFYLQNLTDGGPLLSTVISGFDTSIRNSTSDLRIGAFNGGSNLFNGIMDEVRFSNTALTGSELLVAPEPSMALLSGLGIMGVLCTRRRRSL